MKKRVVITGAGVVSPIGAGVDAFWANCLRGQTRVEAIPGHWLKYADLASQIWSPLPEIDYAAYAINSLEQKLNDPVSLLGMTAAFQALHSAKLPFSLKDKKSNTFEILGADQARTGIYIGTGVGGIYSLMQSFSFHILNRSRSKMERLNADLKNQEREQTTAVLEEVIATMTFPRRFHPFGISMSMPNACASNLGIKLNITGVNSTVCSACAAGTVAVGHGFRAISTGQLDMAFVGGAENMNDDFGAIFRGFDSIGALARNYDNPQVANRPFDTLRSGFLFSQGGAAILVLEELDRARQRGAPVLAEIIGFFETCDAHNIMVLDQSGLQIERMLRMLLQEAGLEPGEVDYINAHGTGTQVNDETESLVIERIFGRKPLVNSTKSLIGHTIGASGALEALVAACSIYHQTTHACKNLHQPLRDLNFVKEVKKYPIRTALSQSFAFGGQNAGIALREYR